MAPPLTAEFVFHYAFFSVRIFGLPIAMRLHHGHHAAHFGINVCWTLCYAPSIINFWRNRVCYHCLMDLDRASLLTRIAAVTHRPASQHSAFWILQGLENSHWHQLFEKVDSCLAGTVEWITVDIALALHTPTIIDNEVWGHELIKKFLQV